MLNRLLRIIGFFSLIFSCCSSAQSLEEETSTYIQLIEHKKKEKPAKKEHSVQPSPQGFPESDKPSRFFDPMVDHYLKNKIVLCVGSALRRYDMLKQTTEYDLKLIPFKKIFITTNEPKFVGIRFNERKVVPCKSYLIPDRGHQVDSANCIISTLRHAVNDSEVHDDDIILFKQESLYINDMELISRAIDKIVNEGYGMVNRMPCPRCGGVMTCTDAFFVKVSAVRKTMENYPDLTELPPHLGSCELYFHHNIVKDIPEVYSLFYCHNTGGPTELGFYHYPTAPGSFWDRGNYTELFSTTY